MNFNALKTLGGPNVQRALFKLQKYAPEILTAIGIAGVVGSTVMIARASTKIEPVVDKFKLGKAVYHEKLEFPEEESEKDIQKQLVRVYMHTGFDFVKLYGPGITLSVASLASILAAHGIMQRRTVALLGAYKAVESAFATYRSRVIEEFGEEKDRDYISGFRTQTIEDEETGKKKKVKVFDPNARSPYSRYFDEYNDNWSKAPEYNLLFLKNQQNYANDLLRARGHIFLNEVYDMLGLERSSAGQAVGWAITKEDGDNYVDFSIFGDVSANTRNFVNGGNEPVILLDFNVDGVITSLIDN